MKSGWFHESHRHRLARYGISTTYMKRKRPLTNLSQDLTRDDILAMERRIKRYEDIQLRKSLKYAKPGEWKIVKIKKSPAQKEYEKKQEELKKRPTRYGKEIQPEKAPSVSSEMSSVQEEEERRAMKHYDAKKEIDEIEYQDTKARLEALEQKMSQKMAASKKERQKRRFKRLTQYAERPLAITMPRPNPITGEVPEMQSEKSLRARNRELRRREDMFGRPVRRESISAIRKRVMKEAREQEREAQRRAERQQIASAVLKGTQKERLEEKIARLPRVLEREQEWRVRQEQFRAQGGKYRIPIRRTPSDVVKILKKQPHAPIPKVIVKMKRPKTKVRRKIEKAAKESRVGWGE